MLYIYGIAFDLVDSIMKYANMKGVHEIMNTSMEFVWKKRERETGPIPNR